MKYTYTIICLAVSLLGSACTTEGWYQGIKQSAEIECHRRPPGAVDECLSHATKQSYPEYEKARTGSQ